MIRRLLDNLFGLVAAEAQHSAPLRDEDAIEHNERLIANDDGRWGFGGGSEVARQLIEHPTIMCRWNRLADLDDTTVYLKHFHGNKRRAVWRRDMQYPECRICYVEDPMV